MLMFFAVNNTISQHIYITLFTTQLCWSRIRLKKYIFSYIRYCHHNKIKILSERCICENMHFLAQIQHRCWQCRKSRFNERIWPKYYGIMKSNRDNLSQHIDNVDDSPFEKIDIFSNSEWDLNFERSKPLLDPLLGCRMQEVDGISTKQFSCFPKCIGHFHRRATSIRRANKKISDFICRKVNLFRSMFKYLNKKLSCTIGENPLKKKKLKKLAHFLRTNRNYP